MAKSQNQIFERGRNAPCPLVQNHTKYSKKVTIFKNGKRGLRHFEKWLKEICSKCSPDVKNKRRKQAGLKTRLFSAFACKTPEPAFDAKQKS